MKSTQIKLKISHPILGLWMFMVAQTTSFGWGDGGHMIVAKISHDRLDAKAQTEADRLVGISIPPAKVTAKSSDFVNAAHWADDVRPLSGFSQTADLHFIDQPFPSDGTALPEDLPKPDNIVKALNDNVAILTNSASSDSEKAEAIRFVIHFVGDIHQPLHCATRVSEGFPEGDRGGNDFLIMAPNGSGKLQSTKLHSYWDGGIGTFPRMGANFRPPSLDDVAAAASDLVAKLPASAVAWDTGNKFDFGGWAQESFGFARDFVYQGLLESTEPAQSYNDAAIALAQTRVVTAGYRLAALLNAIWPDQNAPSIQPDSGRSAHRSPSLPSVASNYVTSAASVSAAAAVKNHWLPDPAMTPGDILPATSDQVCVPGYSKSVRNVSEAEKMEVYKSYGMQAGVAPCPCEIDHLISLELGGSNDKKNLWPQPYSGKWNAHQKDKLENFLHEQVCAGQISLHQAQQMIATNWTKAYSDYGLDGR